MLDAAGAARFTPNAREVELGAGEVLFREGAAAEWAYFIETGTILLTRRAGTLEVPVGERGDFELVGEVGVLCERAHTATATATRATRCLAVDGATLEAMLAGDTELCARLMEVMASHVASAEDRVRAASARDAAARVALLLAGHAEGVPATDDGRLVPRKLAELCARACVGDEELAAVGSELVRARLIRITKNGLLVPEVARIYDWVRDYVKVAAAPSSERRGDEASRG